MSSSNPQRTSSIFTNLFLTISYRNTPIISSSPTFSSSCSCDDSRVCKRMWQKLCIEGILNSTRPRFYGHRPEQADFLMKKILNESFKIMNRISLADKMTSFWGKVRGKCHFFLATGLNIFGPLCMTFATFSYSGFDPSPYACGVVSETRQKICKYCSTSNSPPPFFGPLGYI